MTTSLVGTWRMVRLVLRRDRLRLPLWVAAVVGTILATAAALPATYPDQDAIDRYAALSQGNPSVVAFAGPGHGLDASPDLGNVLVNEIQLWACVGVALMSIFLLNRHTRAEEDVERAELLRSGVLGRHATTAAAVGVVAAANLVIGVASAVGFVALDYDPAGSVALAASIAALGWVFVGATAVAVQVASSGRAALGFASALLGGAFAVRAVGDVAGNGLHWLSPIGWAQSIQAFAGERWWVLALCASVSAAAVLVAFWLSTRRDLGSGLVAQRPGPERAARPLTHPVGFALAQHRGLLIGWTVGMFLVAMLFGSIGDDIAQMVEDDELYQDIFAQFSGAEVTDSFFATSMVMLATFGAGYSIAAMLRPHAEEVAGRAEPILATRLSRGRWLGSYLAVAVGGTVAVMLAAGLGVGVAYAVVSGDVGEVGRMAGAALVTVPAVLVLVGLALALFGLRPQLVGITWAVLAAIGVVAFLGEVLRLPTWVRRLSPFDHLPGVPAEDVRWLPLAILVAIAAAAAAVGLWAFRRRDLRAG